MPSATTPTDPLSLVQCRMLEGLASRAVEASAAQHPDNIPGWVYAGESSVYNVTLVLVALRRDNPAALPFTQAILRRVSDLSLSMFGANVERTDEPYGSA